MIQCDYFATRAIFKRRITLVNLFWDLQKIPGVIAFFSSKDIPGRNSFTPSEVPWMGADEEIFASKNILYYGQPVGVVAAITRRAAEAAAELVRVKYKKLNAKPVLSVKDALEAPDKERRVSILLSVVIQENCLKRAVQDRQCYCVKFTP